MDTAHDLVNMVTGKLGVIPSLFIKGTGGLANSWNFMKMALL